MKTKLPILLIIQFFLLLPLSLKSQVTIGGDIPPQDFSVLEIISKGTGGLRLPHLSTQDRDAMQQTPAFQSQSDGKGKGLIIYNTTQNTLEYWKGDKWVSLSSANTRMRGIIGLRNNQIQASVNEVETSNTTLGFNTSTLTAK